MVTALTVVGVLVVSKVFGFSELVMVTQRALGFSSSLVASARRNSVIREETVRLQGSQDWNELWSALTDFAETRDLSRVRLDLNVPWLHEGYHAVWRRNDEDDGDTTWLVDVPLMAGGRPLGRLELAGPSSETPHALLGLVSELLESIQPCTEHLADELPHQRGEKYEPTQADETGGKCETPTDATDSMVTSPTLEQ